MPIVASGEYIVSFNGAGITNARDLFELTAPSDAVVVIDEVVWNNYTATPPDEQVKMHFRRYSGAPTSGSGGSAATPQKLGHGMAAAGSAVEVNNTTRLSGGTTEDERPFAINTRERDRRWILSADPIILSPGQVFVWGLDTTPSATLSVNASVRFTEYGG